MTDIEDRAQAAPSGEKSGKFASVRQKIASKAAALHLPGRKGGEKKDSPSGKKKKKLSRKKAILLAAGAAVLAAGAYFIVDLFSGEEQTAVTGEITYGSLSQEISGTGTTTQADSVTYSLPSSEADVTGWYVEAGDTVEAGDLLFEQDDSEVDELIAEYEYEILEYEIEIDEARESLAEAQEGLRNGSVFRPRYRNRGRGRRQRVQRHDAGLYS